MPPGPPLISLRLDNLADDRVDQPHTVLFAVTNQRLSNFAVSAISKRVDCPHITITALANRAAAILRKERWISR